LNLQICVIMIIKQGEGGIPATTLVNVLAFHCRLLFPLCRRIRQSRNNAPVEDLVGTAGVYHGEGKVELRKAHFGVPCREPILPREIL
jgi:hypothetical protein